MTLVAGSKLRRAYRPRARKVILYTLGLSTKNENDYCIVLIAVAPIIAIIWQEIRISLKRILKYHMVVSHIRWGPKD